MEGNKRKVVDIEVILSRKKSKQDLSCDEQIPLQDADILCPHPFNGFCFCYDTHHKDHVDVFSKEPKSLKDLAYQQSLKHLESWGIHYKILTNEHAKAIIKDMDRFHCKTYNFFSTQNGLCAHCCQRTLIRDQWEIMNGRHFFGLTKTNLLPMIDFIKDNDLDIGYYYDQFTVLPSDHLEDRLYFVTSLCVQCYRNLYHLSSRTCNTHYKTLKDVLHMYYEYLEINHNSSDSDTD